MTTFSAAPHYDILILLVQIAVLLITARTLGEIAQRFKLPSVVGEIMAGILLGPSLLSGCFPEISAWIIPATKSQGHLLEVISLLGAMFLLLITGLETDFALIRRHARTALGVAAGGLILPLVTGFFLGQYLPDSLLVHPNQRLIFSLFVATAMSISAIPVIAKVLMDMGLTRRDIGQTIIAAGMCDDTVGWILLSIVVGLASGHAVTPASVMIAVARVGLFMAVSFSLGRLIVKRALDFVQDEVHSQFRLLTLVVVLTFAWGAITQAMKLEAVLGAFVMGILFGQMPRLPKTVHRTLQAMTIGIFAPIFFAVAGLKVNVTHLADPKLLLIAGIVIGVATFGKVSGAYIGARLIGRCDHWTALSYGAGLNARGAMEIIIATIGLSLGILTQDMFSIIVLMAMVTSLMAPFALKALLKRVIPSAEELARLKKEEIAKKSFFANIHRVLVPVRCRDDHDVVNQTIEANILAKLAAKTDLSVTLFTVAMPDKKDECLAYLNKVGPLFAQKEVIKKVAEGYKTSDLILDEAKKDYDLLVLGAADQSSYSNVLFTPLVDFLVRVSPSATMVVKSHDLPPNWQPSRILIPTNGATAARHAAEIGFALASGPDDDVILLNVVAYDSHSRRYETSNDVFEHRLGIGHQIVEEVRQLGEALGVKTLVDVRVGTDPETVILDIAKKKNVDLIILGTDLRAGSDKLFFGPRVERILNNAPCPVLVVNSN